ncbi:CopD family protein [Methylomonas sp. LL1]|uniref:CopD family protein n=1 Tax=Methylomonas sp. LL1 TaxID=2785785 RepID=UPI0018C4056C|nr:CopD family protein [Methylomonas sp. LL1]QPK64098.1 CopD family protein [Methylomonas sp. LL1]
MYSYVLLAHILAATVWTGGHLVLAFTVLPRALAAQDPKILLDFEAGFERIGMPALFVQVVSGLWMAHLLEPDFSSWITMNSLQGKLIALKLTLLIVTILTALDARFRVIPNLSASTLPAMAHRVILVTIASVGFVLVGVSFRGVLLA